MTTLVVTQMRTQTPLMSTLPPLTTRCLMWRMYTPPWPRRTFRNRKKNQVSTLPVTVATVDIVHIQVSCILCKSFIHVYCFFPWKSWILQQDLIFNSLENFLIIYKISTFLLNQKTLKEHVWVLLLELIEASFKNSMKENSYFMLIRCTSYKRYILGYFCCCTLSSLSLYFLWPLVKQKHECQYGSPSV